MRSVIHDQPGPDINDGASVKLDWGGVFIKERYFTSLIGLIGFSAFVLNLQVLGSIFNILPSPHPFVIWGAFALILAYTYELRVLLVAGILCLLGYLSAMVGTWAGVYWLSFGERPENFIPAGILLFLIPSLVAHHKYPGFPTYYRIFGALTILLVILGLSHFGRSSYLMFPAHDIEVLYQIVGFIVSGVAIWLGIRQQWPGVTNLGSTFFVIQLYTKFFDWWWDWLPKYAFFLILGVIAIGILFLIHKLRQHIGRVYR